MGIIEYSVIYAAIVATSTLIWNIIRERRKVEFKIAFNYQPSGMFWPDEEGFDDSWELTQIGVTVVNNSRYPAYLQEAGVIFSDGSKCSYHHSDFAVDNRIDPGLNKTYWFDFERYDEYIRGKFLKFGYIIDGTLNISKKRIPKKIAIDFKETVNRAQHNEK